MWDDDDDDASHNENESGEGMRIVYVDGLLFDYIPCIYIHMYTIYTWVGPTQLNFTSCALAL